MPRPETLFDRPYEDKKIVRVSGPFTVESLSPHRVLADGPEDADGRRATPPVGRRRASSTSILDNLRRAGVQNTKQAASASSSSRLDPYPGVWVQGIGEYTEGGADEDRRGRHRPRVRHRRPRAGPRGRQGGRARFADLLVVCGFAFDPLRGRGGLRRCGRLDRSSRPRMNPDLAMGDELLKKTGAGNLFTVFGEPDIDIRPAGDGQVVVEVQRRRRLRPDHRRGALVIRPTTSPAGSSTPTTTARASSSATPTSPAPTTPTSKLRRALRADINEDAWASLNSHRSAAPSRARRPARSPSRSINHYGDEVMKVVLA